jgi:hypothetical protein
MGIIITRTRYHYQPYDDFFRLATLSGFELGYVDEIDPASDNTYIITPHNGEWIHGWDNPHANIIWWDLEWGAYRAKQVIPNGVREVWSSCPHYAKLNGARYVPLGSHRDFAMRDIRTNTAEEYETLYDLALMMYTEPHRRRVLIGQLAQGLSLAPNGWGIERNETLWHSRAMLHIHQSDDLRSIAPLRFAIACAYQMPIISEDVEDAGVYAGLAQFAPYDELAKRVPNWIKDYEGLYRAGQALYKAFCLDTDFGYYVREALS